MLLRIYLWLYVVLFIGGVVTTNYSSANLGDYINYFLAFLGMIGLYSYAYEKKIFKNIIYWKLILVLNVVYILFDMQRYIKTDLLSLLATVVEIPVFYALFKLSFNKDKS